MEAKGKIVQLKRFTVECYRCGLRNPIERPTKRQVHQTLKEIGWRYSVDRVWFCPSCT